MRASINRNDVLYRPPRTFQMINETFKRPFLQLGLGVAIGSAPAA